MINQIIKHADVYVPTDGSKVGKISLNKPIRGFVNVYLNGELVEKQLENLVILDGRMFVLQKIFNLYNATGGDEDYRSWAISYFGVGAGGTEISSTGVVSLLGPSLEDSSLYDPIRIKPGDSSYLDSPRMSITGTVTKNGTDIVSGTDTEFLSQFRVGDEIVVPDDGGATEEIRIVSDVITDSSLQVTVAFSNSNVSPVSAERIVPNSCKIIPSEYFEFIANSAYVTYYTTMKIICIVNPLTTLDAGSSEELSWLVGSQSVKIDEAALYYSDGSNTRLFAHIAFPPKYMSLTSKLTIEWSILA
jgi:hypothetical protein